jgi:hypothetical protein
MRRPAAYDTQLLACLSARWIVPQKSVPVYKPPWNYLLRFRALLPLRRVCDKLSCFSTACSPEVRLSVRSLFLCRFMFMSGIRT